jgi:hypothetical protein
LSDCFKFKMDKICQLLGNVETAFEPYYAESNGEPERKSTVDMGPDYFDSVGMVGQCMSS